MTLAVQATRNPRPGRPPGGIHYSWVIVGTLVVVQVIGSAISQSAGVMVAPLRHPHGAFGRGTGILGAAGGLGAALLAPLVGYLMDQLGWQGTFWSLGVVGGGIILSLTILFRNRPADMGLTPYGATEADPPEVVRSPALERLRR